MKKDKVNWIMAQIFRNIIGITFLMLCLPLGVFAEETSDKVITQEDLGGRRALVGPGCVVNQFASNIQLLSGISGLENLVDEDLDNFATFTTGVAVGVTEQPLFSVKDMNHTYAAGTEAGICMVSSESGGLLSLSVIQLFTIRAYNNGKLIATYPVSSGQAGSGVGLDLIKIPGTDNMAVNLTCTPEEDFDELYVDISGGLDVSVIKELKFKYAFVGKPRQCLLTTNGLKQYAKLTGQAGEDGAGAVLKPRGAAVPVLIPLPIIDSELNKMVDDDLSNSCSVTNIVSIGYKGAAKLSTDPDEPLCSITNDSPNPTVVFPAGSEVGFVYQNAAALNLKLGNYVEIKVFNTDGTTQTERVEAGVLSLSVAEGGKMTSSVIAKKEFYAAEIAFYTAVSANLGNLGVYYGFVNETPEIPHRCPINSSVNAEICDVQSTYQLLSNPALAVEWKLVSAKEYGTDKDLPEGSVTVTPSGKVTFYDVDGKNIPGEYVFEATSVGCTHTPKCTERVMIRRGIVSYDAGCSEPIFNDDSQNNHELSTDIYGSSGALISIDDLKNAENILDKDFNNYASYIGGLSIASNIRVVGVKKKEGIFTVSSEKEGGKVNKRIGFIVESKSTFLNADVLQFFQIRCYHGGQEVYRKLIDETNAVGVGLIEGDQSQKVRFSIEVPASIEFDEFMLWTAGVLKLDISVLNIYYSFIEDASFDCGNPLKCAETISVDNGATAYPDMKFQTASIAGVVQNLGYLIDNDLDSYFLYQNTVQAGSGMVVSVKLGKTLDYRHQFGIIMDNQTFLAGVGLGTWMTVETYYNGVATGDKFDNWGVLGLDVIGYGDKSYLINNPTRNFDEVRITFAGIANVLNGYKLYGLFIRGDKNLNGIPDCMDPDTNCAEDLGLSTSKVCVGEEITLSGQVQGVDNDYKIIVYAPEQMIESKISEGKDTLVSFRDTVLVGSSSFSIKIPSSTAGTGLNIMVYDETGRYLDGITYTVHPQQTEWRQTPLSTDWNEPNNWVGNVNPYCCTNVIIPDGASRYPVLPTLEPVQSEDGTEVPVPADTYCCDGIYFKSSVDADEDNPAQIVNVPELAYNKAWVDVRMMPNRYYMFASPLMNTYTGDLFVPADMNGIQKGMEFEDLTQENAPQNRFNPSVYQRMWKTNPQVRLLDDIVYNGNAENRTEKWGNAGMETQGKLADWSRIFNSLKEPYSNQKGFSVWVDNGNLSADNPVIIRLPKQHVRYNYYTSDGILLPEKDEALDRANNTRFIYEEGKGTIPAAYESKKVGGLFDSAGKLTLRVQTESAGKSFVTSNPFMSDLDIQTLLKDNPRILTLRRYDGNAYISYVYDKNTQSLLTNSSEDLNRQNIKNVIHPLEAFFVDMAVDGDGGTSDEIVLSRDMMLNTVSQEKVSQTQEVPLIRIQAEASGKRASVVLADSTLNLQVETLLDSEVKPTVALFVAMGNTACDMVSMSKKEIPLGVLLSEKDSLVLHFEATGGMDLSEWELVDRANGQVYAVDAPVTLSRAGSSIGRFVLRSSAGNTLEKEHQTYVEYAGNGRARVTALTGTVQSVAVYTMNGTLCANIQSDAVSAVVEVPQNEPVLIKTVLSNGFVDTYKMMIPAQ
ncbi:hypothetical protein QUW02_04155 [Bacteroides eggerthii]|uniref:T9SS C-terminal target domain-containing protein n=1 Tax=Bacteroides eggerthii TaxID=28111 RepID=A0ABT7U3M8_9BACE|nr:hypothetical protein [Bacteroides eggerthii]